MGKELVMPATLAALLLAHTLADFIFQTNWMVAHKRRPAAMAAHIAVVLITAIAATGSLHPALFALAATHALIDAAKSWSPWKGLAPFLADQALHLVSLIAIALWVPDLWITGFWTAPPAGGIFGTSLWPTASTLTDQIPALMALIAGFILATRAGGFAIGLYMTPWSEASPKGLPGGGRAIGLLERGLIFLLVLTGQAASIGFLIAAKSVLRFGAVGDDRAVSEYVIIGTLASFGWAIAAAFATLAYLTLLSPLGIPVPTP
jgi:hypothetical protein